MHTHIHVLRPHYQIITCKYLLQTHMHVYANVCIHALTRIRTHAHMHVHTWVGIYAPTERKRKIEAKIRFIILS